MFWPLLYSTQAACGVNYFLCFSGDFAVLLKAGMTVRQAILYNVLSAMMAYLGMVTGILIGHYAENISMWIFALTAGLFMYVALVDMVSQHLYTTNTTTDYHQLTTNVLITSGAGWHLIGQKSISLILRTLLTHKWNKPLTEIQQCLIQYINCSRCSAADTLWFLSKMLLVFFFLLLFLQSSCRVSQTVPVWHGHEPTQFHMILQTFDKKKMDLSKSHVNAQIIEVPL